MNFDTPPTLIDTIEIVRPQADAMRRTAETLQTYISNRDHMADVSEVLAACMHHFVLSPETLTHNLALLADAIQSNDVSNVHLFSTSQIGSIRNVVAFFQENASKLGSDDDVVETLHALDQLLVALPSDITA